MDCSCNRPCLFRLKFITLPKEDVSLFEDSADRKFEMVLKAVFHFAGPGLQLAIAAISVCETKAD